MLRRNISLCRAMNKSSILLIIIPLILLYLTIFLSLIVREPVSLRSQMPGPSSSIISDGLSSSDGYEHLPDQCGQLCRNPHCVISTSFLTDYHDNVLTIWKSEANLYHQKKVKPSIPAILHFLWIDVEENDKIILNNNFELVQQTSDEWSLFIWVDSMHSGSYLQMIEELCLGIKRCQLHNLSELFGYRKNYSSITKYLMNVSLTRMAVDIMKSLVLAQVGGIYTAPGLVIDVSILRPRDALDFYGIMNYENDKLVISGQFLASKKSHPVVLYHMKMIEHYYGIAIHTCLPYYMRPSIICNDATFLAGALALTVSYYKSGNKYGTTDALFSEMLFRQGTVTFNLNGVLESITAFHLYRPDEYWNLLSYSGFCTLMDRSIRYPKDASVCDLSQKDYGMDYAIKKVIESGSFLTCQEGLQKRIPFISHRIWLSDPHKPLNLNLHVFGLVLKSINTLDTSNYKWRHYFWVNNPDQILPEYQTMFKRENIEIKGIDELFPYYNGLKEAIDISASLSFSLSVDVIKWLVVHHYGGVYMDVDYEVTSVYTIDTMHKCSDIYFSHDDVDWMLNGLIGSKAGNEIAKRSGLQYVQLLNENFPQFPHCTRINQIMLMNLYGHVKPISELILHEDIKPSSVIMVSNHLAVDKLSHEFRCDFSPYGTVTLQSIGVDYRFHSWKDVDQTNSLSQKGLIYSFARRYNNFHTLRPILKAIDVHSVQHTIIPRLIHIGVDDIGRDLLQQFRKHVATLDWELWLWSGGDTFKLSFKEDATTTVYVLPSDLGIKSYKYWILNTYGGLYLSKDALQKYHLLNFANLEKLHRVASLYSVADPDNLQLGLKVLFGSKINGVILKDFVEEGNADERFLESYSKGQDTNELLLPNCIYFKEKCKLAGSAGFVGIDLCDGNYDTEL